jgi:RND family efflux transporter MFP subunit
VKEKSANNSDVALGQKLTVDKLNTGRKRFLKRLLVWLLVLLAVGGAYWWYTGGGKGPSYELVKAVKQDVLEMVEITGNVEAGATLNLSFRESGQIDQINYDVGDNLKKGDIVASLKNRDQELRLSQARANLAGAQANLEERLAGYTAEDIRISEAGVLKAEAAAEKVAIDWENASKELELLKKKYAQDEVRAQLAVDDAKSKYDFALKNQTNTGLTNENAIETAKKDLEAQLYSTGSQIQQSLVNLKSIIVSDGNSVLGNDLSRLDYSLLNRAQQEYFDVKREFDPFYAELQSQTGYEPAELEAYAQTEQRLVTVLLSAQKITTDALSVLSPSTTLSETKITELKAKLLTDSSTISTSLAALNLKYQAILDAQLGVVTSGDSKESEVVSAKNYYDQQVQNQAQTLIDHQVDLNVREASIRSLQAQYQIQLAEIEAANAALQQKKVGPRAVDVAFLRTQVTANQIAVSLAEEALEKTLLRAPIDGVLSRQNIEVGEDVLSSSSALSGTGGVAVFEMISAQKFKINADIAEVDINKLRIGDKADITLDAVGDEAVFEGTITRIDPVQTVIQDVVFYKAEVMVDSDDERIKPGMTATVQIVLRRADGAVTLPEKAVQREDGKSFVRIVVDGRVKNIDVETGIRDLQGNLEIKSGVVEGQEVILRTLNGRG